MGTANQKIYNTYIHKQKKGSKHNTKESHQITSEQKRKGRKGPTKTKFKTINKTAIRTYISIITLNENRLNAPSKRHRLTEWIQKQDPYIHCLQEIRFRSRDTYRLKVRG